MSENGGWRQRAAIVKQLAVIGGTGIAELEGLVEIARHEIPTPFGTPSAPIQEGKLEDIRLFFLRRHGPDGSTPPHRVNYRANLWALQSLGAREIVAINAVGGISSQMQVGCLVVPDQIIDYTWGRQHTFDDGSAGPLMHIDFTEPYDGALRAALLAAAASENIACQNSGVYGATQGPRLETAAEVRRMAADGCDLVGMTGMPEAALAREIGIAYASVCMVVNAAAGLSDTPISLDAMRTILEQKAATVGQLLRTLVRKHCCEP